MEVVSVNNAYAGGGRRLLAWLIDQLFVSALLVVLTRGDFSDYDTLPTIAFWKWSIGLAGISRFIITALYDAAMESSRYQGSLGKIALGIKVTGLHGERLAFSQALLRNLSKFISWIIFCVGFAMIVFDQRKQGLHDKIADTYVVRA